MERDNPLRSLLTDSLFAHLLKFTAPLAPAHDEAAGMRMLGAFLAVGIGLFFLLRFGIQALGIRGLPLTNLVFVGTLLAAFVLAQRIFVVQPFAHVGLRPFADWTRRERLYACQVVALAAIAFAILFRGHLHGLIERHGLAGFLVFSVLTGIVWGMVQEFIYRGWLQTEFTRRFGSTAGLLLANLVFTFGPLHIDYLVGPGGVHWGGLAAVFAIGLIFGVIYRRSGNLWIPAVLHGIWPLNMA